MEDYLFTVGDGTGEIYREDVLAMKTADAIEIAAAAMGRPVISETRAIATLTAATGMVVWEIGRDKSVSPTLDRPGS
jgi:hypothetical protein